MGSQQFQREYIEHLQKRNTELVNRLNHMKECYENKILSKNLNKHYLTSMLEEVLHVCTVLPQEIDTFFDKMTAAMGAVKDLLLRKSEMVQLVENISRALNSDSPNTDFMTMQDSDLTHEQLSECAVRKKAGTVKVSPMINGHIISTTPRIYLNRVSETEERSEIHRLSPIIEASPDTSSDTSNAGMQNFKEIKIPLVRINLNDLVSYDFLSEESPKTRFKEPKRWRKKLSPNKYNQCKRNSPVLEGEENLIKKFSAEEKAMNCKRQSSEPLDPMEGPSWLYEENSDMNSSSSRFIDFRRRKHRFATVFDKDSDCCNYFEKKKKSLNENSTEFYENQIQTNDENIEEIKRRISESSDEFICESSSECGEKYSSVRKKLGDRKRESTKCSSVKNDSTEFGEDLKKELSPSYLKVIHSDSSDGEDNSKRSEQKFSGGKKSFRKNSSKLSCCRISGELRSSTEKSPKISGFEEQEAQVFKISKNLKVKENLIKDALKKEVFVKLEDCMTANTSSAIRSLTRSPNDITKFKKSKSKSKSKTSVLVSPKKEGRVRRKAAPQKLVEPKLITKLRRE